MSGARLVTAFAVLGAPLAWMTQLVLTYSFEEAACAPGDGADVWGVGVRTLHIVVGAAALCLAAAALVAALRLRPSEDRAFLGAFAIVGGSLFVLTIVLTGIGTTVLATCHGG
jgi:hypothetical protein